MDCGMMPTNGYTIFDAIRGAPGSYLSFDIYGNVHYGFSSTLYAAALSQSSSAQDLWSTQWTYIMEPNGNAVGYLADVIALQNTQAWLQANLPAGALVSITQGAGAELVAQTNAGNPVNVQDAVYSAIAFWIGQGNVEYASYGWYIYNFILDTVSLFKH